MEKADKKICLGINKIQAGIILAHCDANEKRGYQCLSDSDIMDIIEECKDAGCPIRRKEIEALADSGDYDEKD